MLPVGAGLDFWPAKTQACAATRTVGFRSVGAGAKTGLASGVGGSEKCATCGVRRAGCDAESGAKRVCRRPKRAARRRRACGTRRNREINLPVQRSSPPFRPKRNPFGSGRILSAGLMHRETCMQAIGYIERPIGAARIGPLEERGQLNRSIACFGSCTHVFRCSTAWDGNWSRTLAVIGRGGASGCGRVERTS